MAIAGLGTKEIFCHNVAINLVAAWSPIREKATSNYQGRIYMLPPQLHRHASKVTACVTTIVACVLAMSCVTGKGQESPSRDAPGPTVDEVIYQVGTPRRPTKKMVTFSRGKAKIDVVSGQAAESVSKEAAFARKSFDAIASKVV